MKTASQAKIWKKNAVLATVVLFICVAAYLNWSYGKGMAEEAESDASRIDGVSSLLSGAASSYDDGAESASLSSEIQEVPVENDYFSEARLSRQQARDGSLEILRQSSESADASQQVKDEALAELNVMARNALKEAQIEGLVMAKGFEDCVTYITDDGVSIVVSSPEGGLMAEQATQIKDIILDQTDVAVDAIRIIEVEG